MGRSKHSEDKGGFWNRLSNALGANRRTYPGGYKSKKDGRQKSSKDDRATIPHAEKAFQKAKNR